MNKLERTTAMMVAAIAGLRLLWSMGTWIFLRTCWYIPARTISSAAIVVTEAPSIPYRGMTKRLSRMFAMAPKKKMFMMLRCFLCA